MRLSDGRRLARFRAELEAWLDEHPPPITRALDPPLSSSHLPDWARDWQRELFDAGWLVPRWPAGLGGRGASAVEHLAYLEELSRRQVPRSLNPQGLDICAPVLVEHGTDEQRERWALPTLRGELSWCLAVGHEAARPAESSPPGFRLGQRGDDEAGLVVTGSEPAPPGAQHADWCLCAVAVAEGVQHATGGIAVVVIDLRSPGVVRPLRSDLTDAAHDPDELIFDEVVVTAESIVDAPRGPAVVQAARAHERATRWTTSLLIALRGVEALAAVGQNRGLAHDPVFRDAVAALRVDADATRALAYRALAKVESDRPAAELAMLPWLAHELEQRVHLAGVEALGGDGLDLGLEGSFPGTGGAWPTRWLAALSDHSAISALAERDRVAGRALGFPPG
jgi:alkylation response protein AidB-like acyl-CoA dehydrogenase